MDKEGTSKINGDKVSLDEYYRDPIVESFTYVGIRMDNLKDYDSKAYNEIKEKQAILSPEINAILTDIKKFGEVLGITSPEIESFVSQFLQKFPLAIRNGVFRYDLNFIFLYILTKILKPRVVIETGCNVGFSSTFIALAVKENNNGCKFYTMDISYTPGMFWANWEDIHIVPHNSASHQKIDYERFDNILPARPLAIVPLDLRSQIIFLNGSSKDILPNLLNENKEVDIFFHDSEHSYENMVRECMTVLSHVRIGGYLLIHDINYNSAFENMFGKKGIVIGEYNNFGVFEKTKSEHDLINMQWLLSVDNTKLNDEEFCFKKIKLDSFPRVVIMQLNGDCNLGCVFCSVKKEKDVYGFSQCIENEMSYCFSQAESFIFKFCGNFQLPLIKENVVKKIQESFPAAEKVFYLHGEYLTPENCDTFMSPWGRLHYSSSSSIQIVLSASNEYFYKIMTGSDNYQRVKKQIQYFVSRRLRNYTKIHLVFIATTINIEDLPDFVRLAADLGVDKVICSYNYIYTPTQKYLSCFFKQELTNKMLYEAEFLANNLNIEIDLPPRFAQKEYPKSTVCREPFSQIMLDSHGHILPCDASEDCHEILGNGKDFFDVWNSQYYQNLRKSLLEGNAPCFKHCLRANPCAVNDFKAHVIHRGVKRDQDIDVLWGDNF